MPNDKKEIAKEKAIKGGMPSNVADKVFKMANDKVAYMAKVAGTPSMQMTPADRVMAEDPTTVKRPLYALESNKDLYTEVSKSGKTITYNTTKDGRPVIYTPGSAVPGNIMQRTSTSAADDVFTNPSYLKGITGKDDNAGNWLNHAYSGSNRALGEFKRQTSNQKREFKSGYSNIDFSSSASTTNPFSGKPISFGDTKDVGVYNYDTDSNMQTIKRTRRLKPNTYRSNEKVQGNINRAVKDWRSGSPASKLGSGIVEVTGNDKPKLLGSFAPNFVSGTPTKPKKKKGPGLFNSIANAVDDLNIGRPANYKGARIVGKRKSKSGPSFKYRGGRGGGRRSN